MAQSEMFVSPDKLKQLEQRIEQLEKENKLLNDENKELFEIIKFYSHPNFGSSGSKARQMLIKMQSK